MNTLAPSVLPWLDALRARGAARFADKGLPTQRDESWKYTGLNRLRAFGLEPPEAPSPVGFAATLSPEGRGLEGHASDTLAPTGRGRDPREREGEGAHAPLLSSHTHRLTFIEGHFQPSLSEIGPLPAGVILGSLANLLRTSPATLEPHFGRLADIERRPMVALNAAWATDGLVLILDRGIVLDRPIELTFLSRTDSAVASYPRHVIVLGDTAEAIVVERHLGGPAGGFADAVTELTLGAGATLRRYAVHAEPEASIAVSTLVAEIGRDASLKSFALTAGGGIVRHEVEAALVGPGGSCQIDGAYLVGGDRHVDTTVLADHRAPHCSSRQTQKGIVDDSGRAVFQGKILVRPDAQKTDGYQLSQTLLLSPEAEIDVKPELEIYADDVKCSHGATSGRLDDDALFFLRARGISEAEARALLIQGFIDGALDEIDHEAVRDALKAVAALWLAQHVGRDVRESTS